ncbi:hypothetical protein [Rhizobium grahamii]|uniref:Transmembrane protein n=2 Tax=Rhizobium grahamii TaxID=1120045 RepID=S3HDQ3_9HYPH|nr:hypothetical protein [Rhizobium grahamii]EPE96859.1 hypothetical protein RGCCGE502_18035 [Rhizobium grahamii CCGE 502]RDJ03803.1 hypothetical protein B5K06_28175 [Rhizobium grahamii]
MKKGRETTGAQVRGQIQSGLSGDRRSGFDPAAAPMETDAEAGGQPISPEQAAKAVEDRSGLKPDIQRSYDVAMREPGSARTTPQTGRVLPIIIIVVLLIIVAVGLAIGSSFLGRP